MTNVFIRSGNTRENFSMVYHELFDLYHGYIGDKATLYYTFLLRYRHNREDSEYGCGAAGKVLLKNLTSRIRRLRYLT